MAELWSPEHKVVLERRLWLAVLRAQADLGVDVPDGVIEAYEPVVDQVDLDSIAARERVTKHDVKARIDEFSALAGHEHIHKGMTSRDLTENVEQLQVRAGARAGPRPHGRGARPARRAGGRVHDLGRSTGRTPQRARAGHDARQALRQRGRGAAAWPSSGSSTCSTTIRCGASRARSARSRTSSTCSTATDGKLDELEDAIAEHLGFAPRARRGRPGVPAVARLRRRRPRSCRPPSAPVQPGHDHPADGRPRSGHRGLQAGPGRLVGHAAQDEHAQSASASTVSAVARGATSRWPPGSPATSGTKATSAARSCAASCCPTRSSPSTGCSRRSSPCSTTSAPTRRSSTASSSTYLPFLATTKLLVAAVRNGVGRETAHEVIKEHAVAAALALREQRRGEATTCSTASPPTIASGSIARRLDGRDRRPAVVHRRRAAAGRRVRRRVAAHRRRRIPTPPRYTPAPILVTAMRRAYADR